MTTIQPELAVDSGDEMLVGAAKEVSSGAADPDALPASRRISPSCTTSMMQTMTQRCLYETKEHIVETKTVDCTCRQRLIGISI